MPKAPTRTTVGSGVWSEKAAPAPCTCTVHPGRQAAACSAASPSSRCRGAACSPTWLRASLRGSSASLRLMVSPTASGRTGAATRRRRTPPPPPPVPSSQIMRLAGARRCACRRSTPAAASTGGRAGPSARSRGSTSRASAARSAHSTRARYMRVVLATTRLSSGARVSQCGAQPQQLHH